MPDLHAHSLAGRPSVDWEPLSDHLAGVAEASAVRADAFGFGALARVGGLLHDIGKCSPAFQAYLQAGAEGTRGPDHSTAGALEALVRYSGAIGRVLAFIIAGHHAGLADGVRLDDRLKKTPPSYAGWETAAGPLPDATVLVGPPRRASAHRGFSNAFLIRMLFSCLVDADFIETERFYARHEGRSTGRDAFTPLPALHERLQAFMAVTRATALPTPVNALRAVVLDHAVGKAERAPGFFTLTVPTGGGKTLASLSFALAHAVRHDLRRVIFVIPFTGARIDTGSSAGHGGGDACHASRGATPDAAAGATRARTCAFSGVPPALRRNSRLVFGGGRRCEP